MLRHDVNSYSALSKILHWLIALIIIIQIAAGSMLDYIPKNNQITAYMLHKSIGLTILVLMIIRIIVIKNYGRPSLPPSFPLWQRRVARSVQYSLYILLIAMPLSGWIMSVAAGKIPYYFGLFQVPLPIQPDKSLAMFMNKTHTILAWAITVLILLHISAALKHYFINKDHVLQSMLPSRR